MNTKKRDLRLDLDTVVKWTVGALIAQGRLDPKRVVSVTPIVGTDLRLEIVEVVDE